MDANLTMPMLFLALFINRLVEVVKQSFVDPNKPTESLPRWFSPVVLGVSLVFGALGIVLFFPSANLFTGLGSSALAEQVATGIVIGGLANGINFVSGKIDNLIQPTQRAA